MFEGLKARLDKLLAEQAARTDPRARAAGLREALIEAKAGLAGMREQLARAERDLAREREELATAERRGRLAADIQDAETAQVAERFAARHRERAALLEKKVAVQREELALAEREVAEMSAQFQAAAGTLGSAERARAGLDAAWRDLEAAGGTRPEAGLEGEFDRLAAERKLYDAAVDAQLAHLKRKLGKE